jgi:hypothetical protein
VLTGVGVARGVGGSGARRQGGTGREIGRARVGLVVGRWGWDRSIGWTLGPGVGSPDLSP